MNDQSIVFLLISATLVLFIWGRVRYDLVAFMALIAGTLVGVIPTHGVFSGFGHPAVVIIALVLIISRGLIRSGSVELISSNLSNFTSGVKTHIALMGTISASLSSIVNNVAALAILMPADTQLNQKAKRKPSATLMALAFTSILGGMVTMIGTASNVVIATYREDVLGSPYSMFDFTPVGLIVAISGVLFIALFGWRLMPQIKDSDLKDGNEEIRQYVSNVLVTEESPIVSKYLSSLDDVCEGVDVSILGIIRNDERLEGEGFIRNFIIHANDLLILEGSVQGIDEFMKQTKTHYISDSDSDFELEEDAETLEEQLTVDLAAENKSGWAGTPAGVIELAEEEVLALEQDSKIREKNDAIRTAVKDLKAVSEATKKENTVIKTALNKSTKFITKLRDAVTILEEKLDKANVANAKLLYQNKALESDSLNERQKQKLVEAVSNAETIEEAKVIFETLQNTVGSTSHKTQPNSLSEAIQKSSSVILSARKQNSGGQEANPTLNRWKFLAGIDK